MDPFGNQDYDSEGDEDYVLPENAPAEDENEAYRIKNDDETKEEATVENVDDLWAEFLKSAGETPTEKTTDSDLPTTSALEQPTASKDEQKTVGVITTTVENKPHVHVEITDHSISISAAQETSTTSELKEEIETSKSEVSSFSTNNNCDVEKPTGVKRPWTGVSKKKPSGLDAAMSAIKRSKKMSVLDRSKKDWDKFVIKTDIKEELETHSRSRDSYLDNQEFLATSDYRKFQKEKEARDLARKGR